MNQFSILLTVISLCECTRVVPLANPAEPVLIEQGDVRLWTGEIANLTNHSDTTVFVVARAREFLPEDIYEIPIVHPHSFCSMLGLCGVILIILIVSKSMTL